MTISKKQNGILHGLLTANKLIDQKKALVYAFTNGRSESSKELTFAEASELIKHLRGNDSSHRMRRKIIKLAHEIGWKKEGSKEIDMAAIDTWCKTYGYLKKPLNDYSRFELPRLVWQFENGPYKHYLHNLWATKATITKSS